MNSCSKFRLKIVDSFNTLRLLTALKTEIEQNKNFKISVDRFNVY